MLGGRSIVVVELLGLVRRRRVVVVDKLEQVETAGARRRESVVRLERRRRAGDARDAGHVSDGLDAVRDVLLTLADLDLELVLQRLNL